MILYNFLDLLNKNPSRIVNVSAIGAKLGKLNFNKLKKFKSNIHQYITSKLCQVLFTIEFAQRFSNSNVTAYSLHPGVIKTEIFRNVTKSRRLLILGLINIFYKVRWCWHEH